MREITDFDREWVSEIAGYKVSDEEVSEFLDDLDDRLEEFDEDINDWDFLDDLDDRLEELDEAVNDWD